MKKLLIVMAALLAGCAVSDGNPWGIVDCSIQREFKDLQGRLVEDKRIKTVDGNEVLIRKLEAEIDEISFAVSEKGGGLKFDPANPPEPYGTCHAGHCHLPDGSTRTYEEIAEEMTKNAGKNAGNAVIVKEKFTLVTDGNFSQSVRLDFKKNEIAKRGTLNVIKLKVAKLRFEATVTNKNGEHKEIAFETALDTAALNLPVNVKIGDSKLKHQVNAKVLLDFFFLDNRDWNAMASSVSEVHKNFASDVIKSLTFE